MYQIRGKPLNLVLHRDLCLHGLTLDMGAQHSKKPLVRWSSCQRVRYLPDAQHKQRVVRNSLAWYATIQAMKFITQR